MMMEIESLREFDRLDCELEVGKNKTLGDLFPWSQVGSFVSFKELGIYEANLQTVTITTIRNLIS